MIRLANLINTHNARTRQKTNALIESSMSELDLIAQESDNLKDFIKQIVTDDEYRDVFRVNNKESMEYLKDIYAAAHERDASAQQQAIQLIGDNVDLVAANYVSWLEDNLEELEERGELTARQRFDAVLKARFALMDSEADDVVAYIMRVHGASMHPETEIIPFIRKFITNTQSSHVVNEARGYTPKELRLKSIDILRSLGIQLDDSNIKDMVKTLIDTINRTASGVILTPDDTQYDWTGIVDRI